MASVGTAASPAGRHALRKRMIAGQVLDAAALGRAAAPVEGQTFRGRGRFAYKLRIASASRGATGITELLCGTASVLHT